MLTEALTLADTLLLADPLELDDELELLKLLELLDELWLLESLLDSLLDALLDSLSLLLNDCELLAERLALSDELDDEEAGSPEPLRLCDSLTLADTLLLADPLELAEELELLKLLELLDELPLLDSLLELLLDALLDSLLVVEVTRPRSQLVSTSPNVKLVTAVVKVAGFGSESIRSFVPVSATVAAMPAGRSLYTAF